MDFAAAFDQTMVKFSIRAKDLARESGVSETAISRFRRGKQDIKASSLSRLVNALPADAKQHFHFLFMVKDMDQTAMASMLTVIAHQLKGTSNKTSVQPRITTQEPALSL